MGKISKSNTLDKEQEAKDKAWLAKKTESKHFTEGTYVLYDGRRYKVAGYKGLNLIVLDEEGGTWVISHPYFMR